MKAQRAHCLVHGEDRVDRRIALEEVADTFGVKTIRTDCDGTLAGVLLRQGLVDEISLLLSPQMTGGTSPKTIFVSPDLESATNIVDLELIETRAVENNHVWLRYRVKK